MLAECGGCGTWFAPDLERCPHCGSEERATEMPKITADGPSFPEAAAPAPAEAGSDELPPPPPVSAPKAEHVSYVSEVLDVPAEEAEAMRKAELVQLAREAAAEQQAPDADPEPAPVPPSLPPSAPPRTPPEPPGE